MLPNQPGMMLHGLHCEVNVRSMLLLRVMTRLGSEADDQDDQAQHQQPENHEAHNPPAVLLVLLGLRVQVVSTGGAVGLPVCCVSVHQRSVK
jgi:hypothetical protein